MDKKILFLDFDGVLFDTLREVYLVNRYYFLNKDFFEEIDIKNYNLFSKYKYLVYNIWMFYYFNPLIFNNSEDIEKKYLMQIQNRDIQKEEEFCKEFLNIRKELVQKYPAFWQNLEKPYEFFFEIKKLYEQKNINVVIISKKNKQSIIDRFNSYNLQFNPNNIIAREILANYSSKGEFIEEYMFKNNLNEAIFVDDNSNNLASTLNNSKIRNILALWGNCEPNSIGLNQKEAIKTIQDFFN